IQYLSPFILHLVTNTKLLRQLLKKDTPWEWNAEHEQAFIDLKDAIKLLRSTVSEEVVKYCKELFSLHGIPKTTVLGMHADSGESSPKTENLSTSPAHPGILSPTDLQNERLV
ncbi:hypothetical protein CAPTEDRAFT_141783, partial [Capitella teleta]